MPETVTDEIQTDGEVKDEEVKDEPQNLPDLKDPGTEGLTPDDIQRMQNAYNYWHTHGFPEKAAVLYECLAQDRHPPANLYPVVGDIRPETAIDPARLEIPPRAGPSADVGSWRKFAKATLDMEAEIIDSLPRKDIISLLESKSVIPKES